MEETSGRKSILESKYEDINRPMSQKELRGLYKKYMNQLKISNEMVYHSKSKYFYFVYKLQHMVVKEPFCGHRGFLSKMRD